MIKLLLRHLTIEKAIDVFFQKIFKNFPTNSKFYKKAFLKCPDEDGMLYIVLYNVNILPDTNNPELVHIRFEYMKSAESEYEWNNETMSTHKRTPHDTNAWFELEKETIVRVV